MASPRFPAAPIRSTHILSTHILSTLRHLANLTRETLPPMHSAGRPFVAAGAVTALLLGRLSPAAGTLGAVATACCAAFFRDPPRVPPGDPGVAGLVARRIVCSVRPGDKVRTGETYGLIRFGSRVDLYLPPGSSVLVHPGQRTVGGETPLARLPRLAEIAAGGDS